MNHTARLRKFNQKGIDEFKNFLDHAKQNTIASEDAANLLENPDLTEVILPEVLIERRDFATRYDLAQYLYQALRTVEIENIEYDVGLWSWLTLFYFDQVCPPAPDGSRKVREQCRYVLNTGRTYFRHILAGAFFLMKLHQENQECTRIVLSSAPHEMSEAYREICDTKVLVSCTSVLEAAKRMYYDPEKNDIKRGAATKRAGGIRRFADVMAQLDCTWDLPSLSVEQIFKLLPDEFKKYVPDEFKKTHSTTHVRDASRAHHI